MTINILVLSCGINAIYHFTKVLKEKFREDFYIIGTDINEEYLVATRKNLDKFYKVPLSGTDGYYEKILDICKKEKINYIIPSLDKDQIFFYPQNPDLLKLNIKSISTPKSTIEFYKNKKLLFNKMQESGLPIPKLYSINNIKEKTIYCIKPINGFGSHGVQFLEKDAITQIKDLENYIIQEKCLSPEITLECFHFNSKISTVARERIETKAGVCTKAKIHHIPELEDIAKKIITYYEIPNYFNLQFMKNFNGDYVITDVNLRLPGGMSLTYQSGWDVASSIANLMLNKQDKIFDSLKRKNKIDYVVRAYTDIKTKSINKIIAFDLDGTLLNSTQRHKIVLDNILKKHNKQIDLSGLIEHKRTGKNNVDYLVLHGLSIDEAKKIQQEWINNIEKTKYLKTDFLYPEMLDKIKILSTNNELILITARNNKKSCEHQIKQLGLNEYFSQIFIVDTNNETCIKKANILKEMDADEMYGDTEIDKKASQIAGIKFIPVYHGFRNKEFLS